MPRLRRDIRHDPSTRTNKPRTHSLRSDSEQIAEDLANLYSVLEFGFGSCKICSVLSLLLAPPTGGDTSATLASYRRGRRRHFKEKDQGVQLLERCFGPKCHAINRLSQNLAKAIMSRYDHASQNPNRSPQCGASRQIKHAHTSEVMPKIILAVSVTVTRNKWPF